MQHHSTTKYNCTLISGKTNQRGSRWWLKCLRFEPRICLRENQDKENELFLKMVSSGTFSCS